jgi:hypothetical protein
MSRRSRSAQQRRKRRSRVGPLERWGRRIMLASCAAVALVWLVVRDDYHPAVLAAYASLIVGTALWFRGALGNK